MMKTFALFAVAQPLMAAALAPARLSAAPDNAARGRQLYAQRAACHKIDKSGSSAVVPNLYKVVGRRAGTRPGLPNAGMRNPDDRKAMIASIVSASK